MSAKIGMLTFFIFVLTSLTESMQGQLASAEALSREVRVMKNLDINRYLGTWYEHASNLAAKATFELGCTCSTAEYSLTPGSTTVDVRNSCRRRAFGEVRGKAYPVSPVSEDGIIKEARFKVDFTGSGPPSQGDLGNYWVLWTDYNYAIVGGPVPFKRLFFLSRTSHVTDDELAVMYKHALDAGVLPVELLPPFLVRTDQDPYHCRDETEATR
ncbi:lipocalin-like protein, related [Neospora caninum Liverpool]|uniref:Lipocalin-like protein, related n=1 Tax=Neospora caninum (strain Liverpool) TaxID=572307 RepID=F0V7J3_NEOCL|nr:lipocalin-like protein, related [Neospora caninum Liverpool]CBZ49684.1 lipocalin-like protein, related [Neospora caninum Liverpool]CEL64268.1 TPA: Lipocalin-like protein, related [Neospora caninum Liverpool]|eukprot:XP_003879719.1 lipocalin-like protein, related [Neospora caninum Liverpool]